MIDVLKGTISRYLFINQGDFQPFVDLTLVFCLCNHDAANFLCMMDVRPAISLQVESDDFDDAYFLHLWWQQINLGANQIGNGESLLAWQRIDPNRIICLDRFVNLLFDISNAFFIQIFHGEIHTCPVGVHLAAGDLHTKFTPDSATKDMKSRMGAHHAIAEIPINRTDNFGADGWCHAINGMPDRITTLIHSYNVGFGLLVIK